MADTGNDRIEIFDTSGNFISSFGNWGTDGDNFVYPRSLALDSYGNIYVADTENHYIKKFIASDEKIFEIAKTSYLRVDK